MRKIALLVAFGAAFSLLNASASAQCANGTCAQPAMTSYRYAPTMSYARGYRAAAPAYAAAQPAPAYSYPPRAVAQPVPATYAAPRPAHQVAQTRPYAYSWGYAPAAASCPNGTCPYVR